MFREGEVRRGIAWLNENKPDWRDRINLETLDLSRADNCVLGHVYGGFGPGLKAFVSTGCVARETEAYGFYYPWLSDPFERERGYNALTETWKALIQETSTPSINNRLAAELAHILETA